MYEDYLQKALSNIITSRGTLHEYDGHANTKLGKNLKNIAAYNVQQAIEHIVKYLIYNNAGYNKGSDNIKQIMTHDIDRLITVYCIPLHINVPKSIVKNSAIYSSWEAESRYSLTFSVRKDAIYHAICETEDWMIAINSRYKLTIVHYRKKYKF